jgi:hypothetical protein
MATWADLRSVIEQGVAGLGKPPFELYAQQSINSPLYDRLLNESLDEACRGFARKGAWPEGMASCEKRILAQRLVFALAVIQVLQDIDPSLTPPGGETEEMLEWLLIALWRLGGPSVMRELETITRTALNWNEKADGSSLPEGHRQLPSRQA